MSTGAMRVAALPGATASLTQANTWRSHGVVNLVLRRPFAWGHPWKRATKSRQSAVRAAAAAQGPEQQSLVSGNAGTEGAGPSTGNSQASDTVKVSKQNAPWAGQQAPPGTSYDPNKGADDDNKDKGKDTTRAPAPRKDEAAGASVGDYSVQADMRHGQEAGAPGRSAAGFEEMPSQEDMEPAGSPQEIGSSARPAETAASILGHQADEMNLPGAVMDPGEPVGEGPQGQSAPGQLPESLPEDVESLMASSSEDDTADSPTARNIVESVTK